MPLGRKMTTKIRKRPKPISRKGGPTLLTPGKIEPKGDKYLSVSGKNESIETMIVDPIIGPSIVPNPPITDIISGRKELSTLKILAWMKSWDSA